MQLRKATMDPREARDKDNSTAAIARHAALIDYIAMMTDVVIEEPEQEPARHEEEAAQ